MSNSVVKKIITAQYDTRGYLKDRLSIALHIWALSLFLFIVSDDNLRGLGYAL